METDLLPAGNTLQIAAVGAFHFALQNAHRISISRQNSAKFCLSATCGWSVPYSSDLNTIYLYLPKASFNLVQKEKKKQNQERMKK